MLWCWQKVSYLLLAQLHSSMQVYFFGDWVGHGPHICFWGHSDQGCIATHDRRRCVVYAKPNTGLRCLAAFLDAARMPRTVLKFPISDTNFVLFNLHSSYPRIPMLLSLLFI